MASSTSHKIVPSSKVSEWRGLDRISLIVHKMGCIWREQEKDDIGIDGEIELCIPRSDGKGSAGTGKIIKVQSKSGQHYIRGDQEEIFESPVNKKDLVYWNSMNVPVVYIVYHPKDERLYWKDIHAYLQENPSTLEEPCRIIFYKETDCFDETALDSLYKLCKTAPERVNTLCKESLFPNFLEVTKPPKTIFTSIVIPEKRSQFKQRLFGFIPPYSYHEGILTTLADPSQSRNAFTNIIESEVESISFMEWFEQNPDADHETRVILNKLLHNHLKSKGLEYHYKYKRFYYAEGLTREKPIKKVWRSSRTKRSPCRTVSKYYEYGADKFFRHSSLSARFQRYGKTWGIILRPGLYFSTDGKRVWSPEKAKSYSTRYRSREYNNHYLNNILFWSFILSDGNPDFKMELDGRTILRVKGMPDSISANFGIRTI
ncbi:MAG: DUF4365 domain-containing protein [Cyanobacteria bacterium P01_G01_bin.54]